MTTTAFDPRTAQPGAAIPDFVDAPSTRTDYVRYQGASGDMNPIHHDEDYARAAGFPTVFAVGMLAAGILGSYLADLFGPANIRRFKVQFREQSWPGDVITYGGRVVARRGAGHDAAGHDGTGHDGTGQGGAGHDGSGQHSTGQGGTGQHGTGHDGTGQHSTGQGGEELDLELHATRQNGGVHLLGWATVVVG